MKTNVLFTVTKCAYDYYRKYKYSVECPGLKKSHNCGYSLVDYDQLSTDCNVFLELLTVFRAQSSILGYPNDHRVRGDLAPPIFLSPGRSLQKKCLKFTQGKIALMLSQDVQQRKGF